MSACVYVCVAQSTTKHNKDPAHLGMRSASHHLYHSINGGISQNVIIFGDEDALGTYVEVSHLGIRAVWGDQTYVG